MTSPQPPAIFNPEEFIQSHERGFQRLSTPPDGLADLLRLCYLASLESEEGRPIRFAAHLVEPNADTYGAITYSEPEPLSIEALRRLAPSADAARTCIVVSPTPSGLCILGLVPLPRYDAWTEERRGTSRPTVSVRGPGRIDLDIANGVLRYESGLMTPLTSLYDLSPLIPASIYKWHLDYVTVPFEGMFGLQSLHMGSREETIDAERFAANREELVTRTQFHIHEVLAEWIVEVVVAVQRLGHGGSCLVLPPEPPPFETYASRGTELRGPAPLGGTWNAGLLGYSSWTTHYWLGKSGVSVLRFKPATRTEVERWANTDVARALDDAARRMQSDAQRLAHLMQIDGALVVDHSFQPRWLGATLHLPSNERKGHRVSSILAAVREVPSSIGLVISQDGNARLISRDQAGSVVVMPLAL